MQRTTLVIAEILERTRDNFTGHPSGNGHARPYVHPARLGCPSRRMSHACVSDKLTGLKALDESHDRAETD